MDSIRGLFPQEGDKLFNSYFRLEEDTFQRFRSQVSSVARYHDMEVYLGGVPQISVAPCLVVDIKTCPQKYSQEFLGRDSGQFWHCQSRGKRCIILNSRSSSLAFQVARNDLVSLIG
jgi:hypothetical protein